jgi:formamidopyrimidine-DNA glycosylase
MPEGPEVRIYLEIINELTKGKKIIDIVSKKENKKLNDFKINLPLKILKVDAIGKLMYFILENDFVIMFTFGLTGSFAIIETNKKIIRYEFIFDSLNKKTFFSKLKNKLDIDKGIKHTPIKLINSLALIQTNKLYYVDQLNFGKPTFGNKEILDKKIKSLGMDPLLTEITQQQFLEIIRKVIIKKPEMSIYEFLMNQKYICGIGNYLSQEILYHSRINPHRAINDLELLEIKRIYKIMIKIMKWSYEKQGGKYEYFVNVGVPNINFKLFIYGKNECKKGDIKIDEIIKGRKVRWCPDIQN